ncbi:hypothetical protein AN641_02530 [Candidatus Epulonipiscioides gigas]|nr:hypothetical protein AN641_02530 [Epulopiscium sp. SCG-C07WGA-EpuloA2]
MKNIKKSLVFFKKSYNKDGFLEKINMLLTTLENNGITLIEPTKQSSLKEKLIDIQHIREWFDNFIESKFLTKERSLQILKELLAKNKTYEKALIIVDGFYQFTNAQQQILVELNKMARQMIVTLPLDREYSHIKDNNVYYKTYNTLENLKKNFSNINIHFCNSKAVKKESDIIYLANNYFSAHIIKNAKNSERVKLFLCKNLEEETELIAKNIKKLVRDENYRYKDISIITGDINLYYSHINTIFAEYEIPYFLDKTRYIHTNPLVRLILNLLDVLKNSWNLNSILPFLKSNMLGFEIEDIDYLENYLYAQGINSKSKWQKEWTFGEESTDFIKLNELRNQVNEIILTVENNIKKRTLKRKISISNLCIVIYEFLDNFNIATKIDELALFNKQRGDLSTELEYLSVYEKVMNILERLVDILGTEYTSISNFKNILSTSFKYEKIGIIPATQDQVLIGEIQRTRLPNQKVVFLMGLNEGEFPQNPTNNSIFSDMDLTNDIFSDNKYLYDSFVHSNLYGSKLEIYTALTKPSEYLFATCAQSDDKGIVKRPSVIFNNLKKLFNLQKVYPEKFVDNIYTSRQAIGELGKVLKKGGALEADYKDALRWYLENEPLFIQRTIKGLFYTNQQEKLKKDVVQKLYGKNYITSVSKIERFRKCPCSYFIEYGLKASERKIFKFKSLDIGNIFHGVLEIYPKLLKQENVNWLNVDKDKQHFLIKEAVIESFTRNNKRKFEGGQIDYTIRRIEKMSIRAIEAITHQFSCGKFEPKEYEYKFDERSLPQIDINLGNTNLHIKGTIDRVDVYIDDENNTYIKIIDYKTSKQTSFNLVEVYYALQLQLLLYLDAYLKINKNAKEAGVYYFKINAKNTMYAPDQNEEDIKNELLKNFQLSGLTLDNANVVKAIEHDINKKIIDVKLRKDGKPEKHSKVATAHQFEKIREFVINKVEKLSQEILDGKVSVTPYKLGNKTACDYCNYHGICGFDENLSDNQYDVLENIKKDKALECILAEQSRPEYNFLDEYITSSADNAHKSGQTEQSRKE